ncbi:GNAT family N-acetyltransferase [Hoyosella subflava]|uniref:GNAT family acetyltransferase n=1 Tax=Hoyosella subflava (strain DSM 45089 / JCM 17490 / NBRC 109087 / DQS3-9A1) TaxID=443218 RepID=F6ELI8_HOYSD|nr:GNAT family N-acetyltransferase [Hoyosella subflava]AEF40238.1 GNAT family acetyltransferase [Hoyosella subflava DQS3-9A1]
MTDVASPAPADVIPADLEIERAAPSDAGELAYVAAVTFPLACPPHTTRADIATFITRNLSPARFSEYLHDVAVAVFVARERGEAIGYGLLREGLPPGESTYSLPEGRTIELSKLYVLPHHHGNGAATLLMRSAIEYARQTSAATLWLGVNQLNVRAQRFYQKSGFAKAGTKTFTVGGETEHDFIFALPLQITP